MTSTLSGTRVKTGFYWNLREWQMVVIPKEGGYLPGEGGDRFLKVPILALFVAAPLMGGLYAIFLPFIGFAMLLSYLARQSAWGVRNGFMEVMTVVAPHWQPGEAYLAGKRRAKAARDAGKHEEKLDAVEREIEAQRKK